MTNEVMHLANAEASLPVLRESAHKHLHQIIYSTSPVQFKMVSMHWEKPICAPPHLSYILLMLPLKQFQSSSD